MKIHGSALLTVLLAAGASTGHAAESFSETILAGDVSADLRLRYESVSQDNRLADAEALTLRTRLNFTSQEYRGLSATVEVEDNRAVFGVDDFSVPLTGFKVGEFSVIADPNYTEIDQGYVQFSSSRFDGKLGRQVLTLDNHRFVGHVGWRQDRQTFDGLSIKYTPTAALQFTAAYLTKRNRIFADQGDIDSSDILVNLAYQFSVGKLTAYAYLLEADQVASDSNDTFGVSFSGSKKIAYSKLSYSAELATQSLDHKFDTDYLHLQVGIDVSGITFKAGFEVLGSDEGQAGFATPLATLHKFNGWADQFLTTPKQGLEDLSASASGKLAGGNWSLTQHHFKAEVANGHNDDLGRELNISYSRKFATNLSFGIKFAKYAAGAGEYAKVDSEKLWTWASLKF